MTTRERRLCFNVAFTVPVSVSQAFEGRGGKRGEMAEGCKGRGVQRTVSGERGSRKEMETCTQCIHVGTCSKAAAIDGLLVFVGSYGYGGPA